MTKKIDTTDVHVEIPAPPISAETAGQWEADWRTRAEAAGAIGSYISRTQRRARGTW